MMRRIDLLPPVYARRRKERRNIALVVVAGLVVLVILIVWWLLLGLRISDANTQLSEVRTRNDDLQTQINELQEFVDLQNEVDSKRQSLQLVMAGDVDWPAVMTEIAMVIPGEVWLEQLNASAGQTEGAAPVGTETAPIPISSQEPFGRVQFQGKALTMPGVANWITRLERVDEFFAVYLNSASEEEAANGRTVIGFNTTLELSDRSSSQRFQRGGQQ